MSDISLVDWFLSSVETAESLTSITGYQGTVSVVENGSQSVIVWNENFEPLAPGCYEAIALEFMEVGLAALARRFT